MECAAVPKEWGNGPETPLGRIGETWEVSDAPGFESVALSPSGLRVSFGFLVRNHPAEIAGDVPFLPPDGRFPLLIKHLLVGGYTSVQVHPGDDTALAFGEAHPGKSEAWVVVSADPGARILLGFSRDPGREALPALFTGGGILEYLNTIAPREGLCLPVPPGTIHAIGGGVTVFEVQTNSQLTYRLYDWGRERPEGLHLGRGIPCLDHAPCHAPSPAPLEVPVPWGQRSVLVANEAFVIERHRPLESATIDGRGRFLIVSSLGTSGGVSFPGGEWLAAPRRTWFVPATARDVSLMPGGDYLVCFVPRPER
jgi:mannose-6-phosphate isomerase